MFLCAFVPWWLKLDGGFRQRFDISFLFFLLYNINRLIKLQEVKNG